MIYTEEQQNVIDSDAQVTFVNAGAGTGKTTTMMGKIESLINDQNILPESLLLCAFTNRDVDEMKRRFEKIGIKTSRVPVFGCAQVMTADKLIFDISKQIETILGRRIQLINDFDYCKIQLEYALNSFHISVDKPQCGAYDSYCESSKECLEYGVLEAFIDWCQKRKCSPFSVYSDIWELINNGIHTYTMSYEQQEHYLKLKEQYDETDDPEKQRSIVEQLEQLDRTLSQNIPTNLMLPLLNVVEGANDDRLTEISLDETKDLIVNFNDHHALISRLFELYPKLSKSIQHILPNTKYIFIDEIQDYSTQHFDIFSIIAQTLEAKMNLFGDPDQCIYQFNGASPSYMRNRFLTDFDDVKELTLTKNYRMKNQNLKEIPNYILRSIGSGMQLSVANKDDDNAWTPFDGNFFSSSQERVFKESKTLFLPETERLTHYAVEAIREIQTNDPKSTITILTRSSHLSQQVSQELNNEHIPNVDLMVFKKTLEKKIETLRKELIRRLSTESPTPSIHYWDVKMGALSPMLNSMEEIILQQGLIEDDMNNRMIIAQDIASLKELLICQYSTLAKKVTQHDKWANYMPTEEDLTSFNILYNRISDLKNDLIENVKRFGGFDCVNISTIHGFKGGESDYVFLLESSSKQSNDPMERMGEFNALYVALTRAKKANIIVANSGVRKRENPILDIYKGIFLTDTHEEYQLPFMVGKIEVANDDD